MCTWKWEKLKIVDKKFSAHLKNISASIFEAGENVYLFVFISSFRVHLFAVLLWCIHSYKTRDFLLWPWCSEKSRRWIVHEKNMPRESALNFDQW